MTPWVRQSFGALGILVYLIAFMFLYPSLYESIGKIATIALWFALIFAGELLWNRVVGHSKRDE